MSKPYGAKELHARFTNNSNKVSQLSRTQYVCCTELVRHVQALRDSHVHSYMQDLARPGKSWAAFPDR